MADGHELECGAGNDYSSWTIAQWRIVGTKHRNSSGK